LLGLKVLLILVPVAQVNAAVFIERTHKMWEYWIEDELACIVLPKWVREQKKKKKSKRDPILMTKLDHSNVSIFIESLLVNNMYW
jgi:hypothetical protein